MNIHIHSGYEWQPFNVKPTYICQMKWICFVPGPKNLIKKRHFWWNPCLIAAILTPENKDVWSIQPFYVIWIIWNSPVLNAINIRYIRYLWFLLPAFTWYGLFPLLLQPVLHTDNAPSYYECIQNTQPLLLKPWQLSVQTMVWTLHWHDNKGNSAIHT